MWCQENLKTCDKSLQKCCDSSAIGGCCNRDDEACVWHSNGSFKGCMQLQYGEVILRSIALQSAYPPTTIAAIVLVCFSIVMMLCMIVYLKYFKPIKAAMNSKQHLDDAQQLENMLSYDEQIAMARGLSMRQQVTAPRRTAS